MSNAKHSRIGSSVLALMFSFAVACGDDSSGRDTGAGDADSDGGNVMDDASVGDADNDVGNVTDDAGNDVNGDAGNDVGGDAGNVMTDAGAGTAPYDLYGTDTQDRGAIPFAVNWPAAPEGDLQPLVVSDAASLAAAIATPGAAITVNAGSYGTLALANDDQHWILDDEAEFSGLTAADRPSRIIIEGGVISPGPTTSISLIVDDFMMRNVRIPAVSTVAFGVGSTMSHRVAFIHNTVIARLVAFFTPGATASDVGEVGSDMIVAANYLQGGMDPANSGIEPALRIMSNHRTIIVDNRARCGFDGQGIKHTYRSHYGNEDFFMRRNMNEYGDGILFSPRANSDTILPSNHMGDHWVYDHLNYYNGPLAENVGNAQRSASTNMTTWPGTLVVVDNTAYRAVQTNPDGVLDNRGRWRWNLKDGDTSTNNIEFPYQAPPALDAWLAADGMPPGADH